jgi:hypothetical protein
MLCVICGEPGEMSTEHVIAKQIRKILGIREPVKEYRETEYVRTDETLAIVLHGVCVPCNRGWLDDLDRQAMPVLKPILLGAAADTWCVLDPAEQATLATWAVKISFLLALSRFSGEDEGWIPRSTLTWLREHYTACMPPPGARVWLGGLTTSDTPSWAKAAVLYGDKRKPLAHCGTFSLGCLVFQVFCIEQEDVVQSPDHEAWLSAKGPYVPALMPIAPATSAFRWPPGTVFTVDALRPLAARLGAGLMPAT